MLKKILASIFVLSMILGSQIEVSEASCRGGYCYSNQGNYCDQYGCY